jgi:putative hydrolase of HD superfamily
METNDFTSILTFLRAAERLKSVYRTAWTADGQPESTAAHTWRLCLMALVLESYLPPLNFTRLLKLCIIHDLGEAIHGDIPAIHQSTSAPKSEQERADLLQLTASLPDVIRREIVGLWEEYEAAQTPEAQVAKALDKIETLLQHNQGANPADFDYIFNIDYGRRFTDRISLAAVLRALIDADTRRLATQFNGYTG